MVIPYTYLLICKPINKVYYGVRYAKNCHPDEFFKSYFTSSGVIHKLLEAFTKDDFVFEIRKTFDSPEKALKWEQKVIRRTKAIYKENWLNQQLSGETPNFYSLGQEPWNKNVPNEKARGTKFYNNGLIQRMLKPGTQPDGWVEGRLNKTWNKGKNAQEDERIKRIANNQRGSKRPPSHRKGLSLEQEYGENKAKQISEKIASHFKDKTYEEIHGFEKAQSKKQKMKNSMNKEQRSENARKGHENRKRKLGVS